MNLRSICKPDSLKNMELVILKAICKCGEIDLGNAKKSAAQLEISSKFDSGEESRQVRVFLNYLVQERFLFPFYDNNKTPRFDSAMGITPKGLDRLNRLQHPACSWIYDNWFGAIVAGIMALIGMANVWVSWNLLLK